MKVRRPRKIKVAETAYKTLMRSETWSDKKNLYGQIHFDKKTIELAKNQDEEELVDTFLHELAHAIFHEHNIDINNKLEEEIVTKLANGLTQFFKDNPKAIKWLLNKIGKNDT